MVRPSATEESEERVSKVITGDLQFIGLPTHLQVEQSRSKGICISPYEDLQEKGSQQELICSNTAGSSADCREEVMPERRISVGLSSSCRCSSVVEVIGFTHSIIDATQNRTLLLRE